MRLIREAQRPRRARRRDGRGGRRRDACGASCCSPRRRWRSRWLLVGVLSARGDHAPRPVSRASILADNYRSVLAAQRMKEALERIDSGAVYCVVGHDDRRRRERSRRTAARSRRELEVQEGNITEAGEERGHARAARRPGTTYEQALDALPARSPTPRRTRGRLLPRAAADVPPRSSSAPTTSWR